MAGPEFRERRLMASNRRIPDTTEADATWSPCGHYRYRLWRRWEPEGAPLLWIMLNPSTADERTDDPTVARCHRWARDWGWPAVEVVNLFAYRATSPNKMRARRDPVGPGNDDAIQRAAATAGQIICAWGNHGAHLDRSTEVLQMLSGHQLYAMTVTGAGEPGHPLYLKGDTKPKPYRPNPWRRPADDPTTEEEHG